MRTGNQARLLNIRIDIPPNTKKDPPTAEREDQKFTFSFPHREATPFPAPPCRPRRHPDGRPRGSEKTYDFFKVKNRCVPPMAVLIPPERTARRDYRFRRGHRSRESGRHLSALKSTCLPGFSQGSPRRCVPVGLMVRCATGTGALCPALLREDVTGDADGAGPLFLQVSVREAYNHCGSENDLGRWGLR